MRQLEPKILRYETLPSTNTEATRLAVKGAAEGLTVVANEQTAGRGRLQRSWISPRGAGLYVSIVLRPKLPLDRWPLITFVSALAVHATFGELLGLVTDIKWPNDILAGERKICGILAESFDTPQGRALIIGIGINLTSRAFPDELKPFATSVEEAIGECPDREVLLKGLLDRLSFWYSFLQVKGGDEKVLKAWAERSSYVEGKSIKATDGDEVIVGITRGIENDGALRVETSNGEIKRLRAGDITSVRPTEQTRL